MTFLLAPVRSSFTTIPNRRRTTCRGKILSTSHRARIALFDERLEPASEEKTGRMRQLQIDSVQADDTILVKELDGGRNRANVVLSKDYFQKEHEAQFLALCPLCAAMYKEFIKRKETTMKELHDALKNGAGLEFPLELGEFKDKPPVCRDPSAGY